MAAHRSEGGLTADGRLSMTGWLVCAIAAIGFAFDIYELLMLPLVIKPALAALGGAAADGTPLLVPGSPAYTQWARALFFVPALAGGVFGLLGGYLTDLLGRRRVPISPSFTPPCGWKAWWLARAGLLWLSPLLPHGARGEFCWVLTCLAG